MNAVAGPEGKWVMSQQAILAPRDRELFVHKHVDEDYVLSDFLGKYVTQFGKLNFDGSFTPEPWTPVDLLYRGKFSNVYLGTHRESGRQVAVKCLKQPLSVGSPRFTQEVLHEIRILHHVSKKG